MNYGKDELYFFYGLHGIPSDDGHSASITQTKSKIGINVKVQKVLFNEFVEYISIAFILCLVQKSSSSLLVANEKDLQAGRFRRNKFGAIPLRYKTTCDHPQATQLPKCKSVG